MLPPRDLSLDGNRSLSLEATACATGPIRYRCSVTPVSTVVLGYGSRERPGTIDVLIGQIDEVLLAEAAVRLGA